VFNVLTHLERFGRLVAFALRAVPASVASFPRPALWLKPLYAVTIGGLPLALVTGLASAW